MWKWSKPKKIESNRQADFDFKLVSNGDKAYVLYTQANSELSADCGLSDVTKKIDVYSAEFDSASETFAGFNRLTSDECYDALPVIKTIGGSPTAVWVSNSEGDPFLNEGTNTLKLSKLENGEWSAPQTVASTEETIINCSLAASGRMPVAVYTADSDNDLLTTEDRKLVVFNTSSNESQTIAQGVSSAVETGELMGNDVVMWYDNAEDEMNKTIEEGGLDREPDSAGSMEDIQKRLKEFEEAAAKLAGKFEQDSVGYDKNLPTHALDLGENTTFVTRGKDGSKVVMTVVDTKVVTEGGKDLKVQFLDGSNYDQSKLKPQHTTTWVFHMQAKYQADIGTTLKNESTEGVFATSDREGNWAANLDQAYKSNTAANSRGEPFESYAAIELPGAVALYKGDDGKFYERVVTGVDGVNYREISEAKFNEVAGDEYTKASMEGNKNLEASYNMAVNKEKSAVAADGSVVKVKFTNVYDNKVTDEELYKMESLGRAMATRDEFNYTEEELSNMKAVSHGMLDSSSGKLEGLPSRNRKLLDALVKGLRR